MTRNLKLLGVALIAALALTALVASAASAANYTASSYPTTMTGESPLGNNTLKVEHGSVECKAHYEGTLVGASSSLTVKATYTECRALIFLSASFNMGSCDYLFAQPSGSADSYTALMSIKCTNAASPITIVAGTCKMTIGEQGPLSNLAITNETASGDIKIKFNLAKIGYTVTEDGFGCPFTGTGARGGATYTHDSSVTLDSLSGSPVDVG